MKHTKATAVNGLQPVILPVVPLSRTFTITAANGAKSTVTRQQLPITPAYARDIGSPPTGHLTPFNAYISLSRSRSKTIRLLRDFDDKLFMQHPSEYLRSEDHHLEKLDEKTTFWLRASIASADGQS